MSPETPPPAQADLYAVWRILGQVRRRLRLQAASIGAVQGAIAGAGILLVGTLLHRFGRLPGWGLRQLLLCALGLLVLGALLQALRRIHPLEVAARVDKSHALNDRLGTALQFEGARPADGATGLLRQLAIADAARATRGVEPARAAPWHRPPHLFLLGGLCLATVAAGLLQLPRRATHPQAAPPAAPTLRLSVDAELLQPEREEVAQLLAQAERSGDEDLRDIALAMQKLLDEVERGELTRKEAFDRLAELEQRIMEGKDGALEALREQLRKAGAELGRDKLAKEFGRALEKEDLDKARKELEKLAKSARDREKLSERQGQDRKDLAQALRRAASPDRDKQEAEPKEQWKDRTDAEKRTAQEQALREEERRLKKKLEENPKDEETARRLKKTQRELERLQREKQERAEAQRELERLRKDMEQAAEELEKQLQQMTPEQRKALEQLAKDMSRMQDEIRKLQQQKGQGGQGQQGAMGQARLAIGSLKQVLRRVGKTGQGQNGPGGQGQGQGQAQNGKGQGQGQSQKGQNPMKDFLDRAGGKGKGGDSDVLVEGDGKGKGDQQVMILGEGNTPLILPGLGGGQGQGQQGQGQGKPGADGIGKDHDPNLLGDPSKLAAKLRNTRVQGKEGAGPTRSETILGSAERGFAATPYRKVYQDYTAVTEEVMSRERVPPGYRFYVKRYFQLIKPRE